MRLLITVSLLLCTSLASADIKASVSFSTDEVRIIADWYAGDTGSKKKSKGKGGKGLKVLPPGIAKNLARGKPLPPGIAKQALPVMLVERLPPAPKGYERVIVDGRVLLVEIATHVIHDVLEDLILG